MKYTTLILFAAIAFASCKKDAPEPQPPSAPSVTNQQLYGDWLLREKVTQANDSTQITQYFNSPTCHLLFTDTVSVSDPSSMNCIAGHLYCSETARVWKVQYGSIVMSGVQYSVLHVAADSLVIKESNKTYYFNR